MMARFAEPTTEDVADWNKWVASRPDVVRVIAERFPPWELFRMKSTGQRVPVIGFFEDGTLRVYVSGRFNLVDFEREVFGISPDDLEPCDLPGPGDVVGELMTQEEFADNLDAIRVQTRPDLWRMGDDGKAVWLGDGPAPDDPGH